MPSAAERRIQKKNGKSVNHDDTGTIKIEQGRDEASKKKKINNKNVGRLSAAVACMADTIEQREIIL